MACGYGAGGEEEEVICIYYLDLSAVRIAKRR